MLFDQDIERTRSDGRQHDEGDFDYLNVSGRPEAAAVRELLESWLANYPSAHRTELIQRLRHSDQQFASASFELLLYTVLARLGWRERAWWNIQDCGSAICLNCMRSGQHLLNRIAYTPSQHTRKWD